MRRSAGLRGRTRFVLSVAFAAALLINLALLLLIGSLISRRQTELVDAMNPQPIDFIRIVRKDEEPKSVEPVVETVVEDEPEPKPAEKPPEPKPAKPSPKKQTNTRPRPVSPRPAKPAARLVPAPKIDVPEHGTGPAFAPVPGSDSRLTAPPSQWDTSKNASESTGGSGSGTGDGGGYSVRRLVVLSRVMPRYPRRARESGIEGWVKLAIVVSPEGKVTEARVVDSEPKRIFDRAALEAIKRWRFKPTYKDGRAVVQRVVQEISFRLDKRR